MFLGSLDKTIQVDFSHLGIILLGFHLPPQKVVDVLRILCYSCYSNMESSDAAGLLQS